MKASEHIQLAIHAVARGTSAWKPHLMRTLESLVPVAELHEEENPNITPPQTTAMGHKPKGKVVTGNATQTDAALAVLECSD